MRQQTMTAVAVVFVASISIGGAFIVAHAPAAFERTPDCWARLDRDGQLTEVFGSEKCKWQRVDQIPPRVRFNYAPLTPEQAQAYETQ